VTAHDQFPPPTSFRDADREPWPPPDLRAPARAELKNLLTPACTAQDRRYDRAMSQRLIEFLAVEVGWLAAFWFAYRRFSR
jgi:hypothetical protein